MGAESLLGQGDMLYLPPGDGHPQRVHGAYVADDEVQRVVEHLKRQGEAQYIDGILDDPELAEADAGGAGRGPAARPDPLYDQAVQIVLQNRRASISLVQRHLRIGYNRAARLIEDMERAGLVSPMASNGNREILGARRGRKSDGARASSLAALAACAPLAASAGAVDAFLAFTASSRTATARFEQQVFDRSGKLVDRSSGSFAFSRPGTLPLGLRQAGRAASSWPTARGSGSTTRT